MLKIMKEKNEDNYDVMDSENDNPEMKDIMRIRTLLNRKQKNAEGKAKQKEDVTERKLMGPPVGRAHQGGLAPAPQV